MKSVRIKIMAPYQTVDELKLLTEDMTVASDNWTTDEIGDLLASGVIDIEDLCAVSYEEDSYEQQEIKALNDKQSRFICLGFTDGFTPTEDDLQRRKAHLASMELIQRNRGKFPEPLGSDSPF
jgi:IMP cyclohydrolase